MEAKRQRGIRAVLLGAVWAVGAGCLEGEVPELSGDPLAGEPAPPDPEAPPGLIAFAIEPAASSEGWRLFGASEGLPSEIHGVSADAAGNLWVAGGRSGLFVLRPGAARFERLGLEDGLTPYAESAAHPGPIGEVYLDVISVTGGDRDTAFVGYRGISHWPGVLGCEDNWDGPAPDPAIYKSGDADRVRLRAGGVEVTHYDISSGVGVVAAEPRGREKVCDVYRILYDARTRSLWLGGNHGYAWADPDFEPVPGCGGLLHCSGVYEHAHPLLNGYLRETSTGLVALTNDYFGLALDAAGWLWVGGRFRSQRCPAAAGGSDFWTCESEALSPENQIDWWPDTRGEGSRPSERVDDRVSAMAVDSEGAVWIGSPVNGLLLRDGEGRVSAVEPGSLVHPGVHALAADPLDGSIWVGGGAGGLTRLSRWRAIHYGAEILGAGRVASPVSDIQIDTSGARRRVLVAFRTGAVGVYEGD